MTWAIYCRISKDVTGAGAGVDRQHALCLEFAKQNNLEVYKTYTDNDISAFSGVERPAYSEMMDAVKNGEVEGIICWHVDRLFRRSRDLESLVEIVESTGIQVRTVKAGELDLNSATGRLTARMVANIANYEVDHLIERLKASEESRAAKGQYRGGYLPFGYRKGEKKGTIELDPETSKWGVIVAHKLLAGVSLRAAAKYLNDHGVLTNYGNKWRSTTLRNFLLNPTIAGHSVHKGKIVGKGQWPALLDEATWNRVRALLMDPSRRKQQGTDRKWQGAGVYQCGLCESPVYSYGGGSARRAYKCGGCGKVSRNQEFVDGLVNEVIFGYLSMPENRLSVLAKSSPEAVDVVALENERAELLARKTTLGELFGSGVIDRAQLVSGSGEVERSLGRVEKKLSKASELVPGLEFILREKDIREAWGRLSADNRADVIRMLLNVKIFPAKSGPSFDPSKIEITWK